MSPHDGASPSDTKPVLCDSKPLLDVSTVATDPGLQHAACRQGEAGAHVLMQRLRPRVRERQEHTAA